MASTTPIPLTGMTMKPRYSRRENFVERGKNCATIMTLPVPLTSKILYSSTSNPLQGSQDSQLSHPLTCLTSKLNRIRRATIVGELHIYCDWITIRFLMSFSSWRRICGKFDVQFVWWYKFFEDFFRRNKSCDLIYDGKKPFNKI